MTKEIKPKLPFLELIDEDKELTNDSFIYCQRHNIPLKLHPSDDPTRIYVSPCPMCLDEQLNVAAQIFINSVKTYIKDKGDE